MNTGPNLESIEQAEVVSFICMLRQRYPGIRFRRTSLGTLVWRFKYPSHSGLPEDWMLVYLLRHQALLGMFLSPPYDNEISIKKGDEKR